jgi:WD40 repeat protein
MLLAWLTKKLTVADGGRGAGGGAGAERPTAIAWQDGLLAVAGVRSAAAPAGSAAPTLRLLHLAEPVHDGAPSALPPSVAHETVLSAHDAPVRVAAFNDASGKLATGDDAGTVVVWGERDGGTGAGGGPAGPSAWAQELANRRRGHGPVVAVAWRSDGEVVALGWRDGAVVVGSAAGRRLWARDDVTGGRRGLSCVTWAPDGHVLLFACGGPGREPTADSGGGSSSSDGGPALLTYSAQGSPLGHVPLPVLRPPSAVGRGSLPQPDPHVVAVEWTPARASDPAARGLAVALSNGRLQLMSDESDVAPVAVDTGLEATAAAWSPDGSLLAVAGVTAVPATRSDSGSGELEVASLVRFYDGDGRPRGELELPRATAAAADGGSAPPPPSLHQQADECKTTALCWDPTGLRLAVSEQGGEAREWACAVLRSAPSHQSVFTRLFYRPSIAAVRGAVCAVCGGAPAVPVGGGGRPLPRSRLPHARQRGRVLRVH